MTTNLTTEVLVVGGGPAGAAAGYWLARHGHDVTIVERKTFPRDKTCGDALTPRAVHQLREMGLAEAIDASHRSVGLRATGMGRSVELDWPSHHRYPSHGLVVRRRELDALVAGNAGSAGATLLTGHEAMSPLVDRGFARGATVQVHEGEMVDISAKYVIVADGANSRFGRALGTFRTREWPYGTAIRTYWRSPRHAEPRIETALDLRDRNGNAMPGYGWIFPLGDGSLNVGVGLLSTFRDFKSVNTTHLLDTFAQEVAERWEIDPALPECPPTSGRIPMGGSVGPNSGPSYLVVGDAAGSVNPFNGDGVDYALATGRMAAQVLHEALTTSDPSVLQQYTRMVDVEYAEYFKVARLFARFIGRPALMRELTRTGLHNRTLMEWMLRIMTNLLRDDEKGPAELAYAAATKIVKLAPNA